MSTLTITPREELHERDVRTYVDAACRGAGEVMFPLGREGSPGYERGLAEAREICRGCPLLDECFAYALRSGDDFSVLAGTTPDERRAMRRTLKLVNLRKVAAPAKRGPKPRAA